MVTSKKTVHAPAKLNIRLKVTGRRPDGYHELVSIMVPISLFDHLELKIIRPQRTIITSEGYPVPNNEKNLAYRAAQSFFSLTGINSGLSIKLTKNIPVAAGLGGGSSNAACTLKALNEMWSNPLTSKDLMDLALSLGADVPFFLHSRPCLARGIGEILKPIGNWPKFWYIVITPPLRISTSWAYGNLKLKLTTDENNSIINTLGKQPLDIIKILENDLETVTASHFPVISTIKKLLVDAGANGALMSGSGPSVFGIFRSKDQALSAKRVISSQNLGEIFMCWGVVKR
ncbi:MAG: 4-(cytidine 5'-diphospho)-2-C-methyl-D-erythritol kinase [Desulfobacteraceae bacterium]|nr:4-(cytidine 5'-diphospho)-2-C-methyl-D-erythritol kinase [Desulfobacteraceae bacterium]